MANEKESFSVVTQESDERRTIPVSGAWGGPSPDGTQIVAHLYVEYPPVPSILTGDVEEGGRVNIEQARKVQRADVVREVMQTIVLTPHAARSLGQWLIGKADVLEQRGE